MKQKLLTLLLTALMGLTGMNAWALGQVDGVYQIGTAQDLVDFATIVNGGTTGANAVLTADIDCSSIMNWTPIGSATDKDDGKYKGTFDGQGHTISNLVISRTIGCTGIFNTTAGVTLKNFIVDSSCSITDTGANLAGIVGRHQASGTSATATSTFSGIGNAGDVTISGSGKENPGGLIGGCWGKKDVSIIIENCWTSGTVTSSEDKKGNCGAFIGWMNGGKLSVNNCWTIATVETAAADKYLVRAANNTNTSFTFNNCYSLNGTQVPNLDAKDDVASGALCFKLNEALSADVWFQNLDNGDEVDEVPVPFSTHGIVYKNASYLCPNTIGGDVTYSNTDSSVIPGHNYADGYCTYCGYLVQDSEGCFEISNAKQLAWFANHANNTNPAANAKLTADIDMKDIAATWVPIGDWHTGKVSSAFSGHFDGQGHKISNFNVTTSQTYYGIFGVVSAATIENFSIEGTITNDSYSNFGVIGYSRDATTNIRNIQSYLTLTNNGNDKNAGGILGSGNAGMTNIDRCAFFGEIIGNQKTNAGGIIGYFKNGNDAIVNITNCLFDGKISSEIENSYCGGMAGYGGANVSSVTITNCLSLGTLDAPVTGQFFGNIRNAGSTIANCYYQGENTIGSGSTALTNVEATAVTDEQLESGEVCYLLNGDQTAITWYQTIGTDDEPTLDATNGQVYVNGTVCPDTGTPQGTVSYSNTPGTTVGSHVSVDGFCTYCGTLDASYMTPVDGFFEIGTPAQLKWFAVYANQVEPASNAVLTADIDLTGVVVPSIGNSVAYAGVFDGQGYAISNYEGISEGYGGFFGKTNGATIKNFSIDGILTVTTGTGSGVIGWPENSTISNIHSALVIEVPNSGTHHVGGVVGSARGTNTIDRCTFSGSMTVAAGSTDNFAGVVAYVTHDNAVQKHDEVTNCANYGTVTFYDAGCAAGGVLGYLNSTAVVLKNCLSVGEITFAGEGSPKYGGAILGRTKNTSFTKITNNFWLEGSAYASSKNDSGVDGLATESSTAEQFANGEVASKMAPAFRQNIGTDTYPVLDPTHNVVTQITEAGYATLYVTDTDLTIPEGVNAYTGVIIYEGWLSLNAVDGKIAAEEPVILKGEAGIYSFAPTTGATKAEENVLKGAAVDTEAAGKYILAKCAEKPVGFYKATEGTIKAGKAYLELPEESSIKAFYFAGDEATGIENLNNQNIQNTPIFNLAGQKLSKMQKGINIIGGKKVLK